jgi:pimeloyl-ACP methyl ester carboxylesterase
VARILLIHGFVCDARFWEPQIVALRGLGHEVLAPDLPFHGGPTRGVEASLEGIAGWVLRDCLQEATAVLIGHSLGGMIALQAAHDSPQSVAGIALVDSFPSLTLNQRFLPEMFVSPPDDPTRLWVEQTREAILDVMTPAMECAIWPSVERFNARPWLAEIRCPVLGVYGGRGRYGEGDAARLKTELMLDHVSAEAHIVVVPDAGHFVNLECPGGVNEALRRWLHRQP